MTIRLFGPSPRTRHMFAGVLTITVPKAEVAKSRDVEISEHSGG